MVLVASRLVFLTLCLALAVAAATAQPRQNAMSADVISTLRTADTFELLSLNGEPDPKGWHGYRLLGRTTIAAADVRARLLAALESGIAGSTGPGARCFVPRHGIRAVRGGATVELLICFECSWVRVFTGGAEPAAAVVTTADPQAAFDDVLRAATLPRPQ